MTYCTATDSTSAAASAVTADPSLFPLNPSLQLSLCRRWAGGLGRWKINGKWPVIN